MVQNARKYNAKNSGIYEDAERLRKVCSTYMTENNPKYKLDRNYVSIPTLARGKVSHGDDWDHDSDMDAEGEPDEEAMSTIEPEEMDVPARRPRGRPRGSLNKVNGERSSTTPASEIRYSGPGFAGLSFQHAQEKILSDLQTQTEDGQVLVYLLTKIYY